MLDNNDFGYYKVNIERSDRCKAKFTAESIETLRLDKTVKESMEWAYSEWGDDLYNAGMLKQNDKEILRWCEENDISLSSKNRTKLFKLETWQKQAALIEMATMLMNEVGGGEFSNFNTFKNQIDQILKAQRIELSASEKNAILGAVSWYDESADKVIKSKTKLSGDKFSNLLDKLGCDRDDLADFGYYATGAKRCIHHV